MLPQILVHLILLLIADARQITFTSQHELVAEASADPPVAWQLPFGNRFHATPISHLPGGTVTLKSSPTTVYRPRSQRALHVARMRSLHQGESTARMVVMPEDVPAHASEEPVTADAPLLWDEIVVPGPDVTDLHTLAQLARMAGNAYVNDGVDNPHFANNLRTWYDLDPEWSVSFPFGYTRSDGFRGHVMVSPSNDTIVLSIKGTTIQGPTSTVDKLNDNLLFSCCCARVDITWVFRTVCDCYVKNWRCDNTCLREALVQDSLFYSVGVALVTDLMALYPRSTIWLVGHSLGGALASLLGTTFGLPSVAFESPGERLAAERLGLAFPPPPPSPPSSSSLSKTSNSDSDQPTLFATPPVGHIAVTHVYHTADPIPHGTCTGPLSPCAQGGYALETRCHLGKSIVFDSVRARGWSVDIRKHPIKEVVGLLEWEGWEQGWEEEGKKEKKKKKGKGVPKANEEVDCVDCFKWEFGDFRGEER